MIEAIRQSAPLWRRTQDDLAQGLLRTLARLGSTRADEQGIIAPRFPPRHRVCMEGRA
jgi:hypothetical protein